MDADEKDRVLKQGMNWAYIDLLGAALRGLGRPSVAPDATPEELRSRIAALEKERSTAIIYLRDLCAEWGDNDWSEDLHLRDILDKHLGRYLESGDENV